MFKLFYLELFFISLILTVFITPYLIKFLNKRGVVDVPGGRRVNKRIVPRMGGAVILLVVSSVTLILGKGMIDYWQIYLSAFIVGLIGMYDDIKEVNWKLKFGAQFIVAGLLLLFFMDKIDSVSIFGIHFYPILSYFILFFFVVGVMNAINLMDGLDGLVSGYSFLTFSILLALTILKPDYFSLILLISLLGSLLGFMKFNTYPARIFLGDTGSLVLGFLITFLALNTSLSYNSSYLDLTFPLILLAVPVLDTLRVMTVRLLGGKSPFLPDQNHLHHVILHNGIKHRNTVFVIQIITSLFGLLAIAYIDSKSVYVYPLFISLVLLMAFIKRVIRISKTILGIKKLFKKLDHVIDNFSKIYHKYILFAAIPAVGLILYVNIPGSTSLTFNELKALFVWVMIILALAFFHQFNSTIINHIYVYFNIILFFLLNNLGHPFESVFGIGGHAISGVILPVSVLILFIVTGVFFFIRGISQKERERFLSGLDLILLLFVVLALILPNMIKFGNISLISLNLLIALLIYLWYRIFVHINDKYTKLLFYLSFALPVSSLILLMF